MDAKLNQFAKVDDFERALILAQYAHEQDFRAGSALEFYQFFKSKLDLTGLSNTAGLPEEFPEPNATLAATNAHEWTVLGPGKYNKIVSGEIDIADDEFAFAQFDGSDFNRVVRIKVPLYTPKGGVSIDNSDAPSGEQIYTDLFDLGRKDLEAILVNKGKLHPFKNYYTDSDSARIRLRKAILDVVLYANNTDDYNYVISQISINSEGSGNRIDVRRKSKSGEPSVDFSFRTIGISVDNSQQNTSELEKLSSGNIELVTLVPADNSFKIEIIADTSEFENPEQINLYQAPWADFVFKESVYKKYEVAEVSNSVTDIGRRMPVKYVNTGVTLDNPGKGLLKSDGSFYNTTSANSTTLKPIDRTKDLYVTLTMTANSATGVAYYDESDSFVGTDFPSNGTLFTVERGKLNPPQGAVKVAYCSYRELIIETTEGDNAASQTDLNSIQGDINTVNSSISNLDARVTDLEHQSTTKLLKAIQWQMAVENRKHELIGEYLRKVAENPSYEAPIYGVEWSENNSNPNAVSRVGDILLHQNLPIQSKIRRCIVRDGVLQYYLHQDNSYLKEDGVTPALLDGSDGDVMVEVPEFFFRATEHDEGNVRKRIEICEEGVVGFSFSPKYFLSAYQSTVDRTLQRLASVCSVNFVKYSQEIFIESETRYVESGNTGYSLGVHELYEIGSYTANATRYRGNVNESALDGETDPNSQNYSRNNLGRPVANINRRTARMYAEKGNALIQQYDGWKALYYLITIEYATRQIQQPVTPNDENGLRQGGLGWGATCYPDYQQYESHYSPQGGTTVIPNGITNELGNGSGEVFFRIKSTPVRPLNDEGDPVGDPNFIDVIMPVNSYRGVENIYGPLYEIIDNIDVVVDNLNYPLKRNTYYYQSNPYLTNDLEDISGYENLGSYEFNSSVHVITKLMWGKKGHILPVATGSRAVSAYDTHYCDPSEHTGAWGGNINRRVKYITYRGRIVSRRLNGLLFSVVVIDVDSNRARTSDTVRFQYFSF